MPKEKSKRFSQLVGWDEMHAGKREQEQEHQPRSGRKEGAYATAKRAEETMNERDNEVRSLSRQTRRPDIRDNENESKRGQLNLTH